MAYDTLRDRVVLFGGSPADADVFEYFAPVRSLATFVAYGAGCASSAGALQLAALGASLPYVGEPFRTTLSPLPTGLFNIPFVVVGASDTTWAGLNLPLDLGTFGMLGCHLSASAEVVFQVVRVSSAATITLAVPYDPVLAGQRFYLQGLVTDALANSGGLAWSNAGAATIGQR